MCLHIHVSDPSVKPKDQPTKWKIALSAAKAFSDLPNEVHFGAL